MPGLTIASFDVRCQRYYSVWTTHELITTPAETKSWISISAMNGTLTYTLMGLKSKSASSLSTLLP